MKSTKSKDWFVLAASALSLFGVLSFLGQYSSANGDGVEKPYVGKAISVPALYGAEALEKVLAPDKIGSLLKRFRFEANGWKVKRKPPTYSNPVTRYGVSFEAEAGFSSWTGVWNLTSDFTPTVTTCPGRKGHSFDIGFSNSDFTLRQMFSSAKVEFCYREVNVEGQAIFQVTPRIQMVPGYLFWVNLGENEVRLSREFIMNLIQSNLADLLEQERAKLELTVEQ